MSASNAAGVKVFPVGPVPANLLRWHLVFDRPVDTVAGEGAVTLLDGAGAPVPHAFVELPGGLWDDSGTRLTLVLHPGRIKSGLRTQLEVGGAFTVGHRMRLRMDLDRIMGAGTGIAEHDFTVVPALERAVDLANWRLDAVEAGSLDALRIEFDRTLDRFSLEGALALVDPSGDVVEGAETIDPDGGALAFRPRHPWWPGLHRLVVAPDLEDLAGNRVGAAFESPLLETRSRRLERAFEPREPRTGSAARAQARHAAR